LFEKYRLQTFFFPATPNLFSKCLIKGDLFPNPLKIWVEKPLLLNDKALLLNDKAPLLFSKSRLLFSKSRLLFSKSRLLFSKSRLLFSKGRFLKDTFQG